VHGREAPSKYMEIENILLTERKQEIKLLNEENQIIKRLALSKSKTK
jgi:hypothetical protein